MQKVSFFNISLGRRELLKDHKDGGVQTRGEWTVSTGHWLLGSDFSLGIGKKLFTASLNNVI